jgi:hypothetical protein
VTGAWAILALVWLNADAPPAQRRGVMHEAMVRWSGCDLVARPQDPRSAPLMLSVRRERDDRWLVSYAGLAPGRYDLANYIECAGGAPALGLDAMPVEFEASPSLSLQLDTQTTEGPTIRQTPSWVWLPFGAAWCVLPLIIWVSRRLRPGPRPPVETLHFESKDTLDSLVAALQQRDLSTDERGRLELMVLDLVVRRTHSGVVDYSRENLYLLARRDPAASDVVDALEAWLHRPPPASVDADRLRVRLCELARSARSPEEVSA